MGDKTGIQWTDATWNCVVGCEHVSPGCDNCYAASLASGRLAKTPTYARLASGGKFNGTIRLLEDRLDQPLRWRRPRMIFGNSMSDWLHKDVPDQFIARMFAVITVADWHIFQFLTKRHGRLRTLLNSPEFHRLHEAELGHLVTDLRFHGARSWADKLDSFQPQWPIPNLWLGVSVENQQWADIRIPALLDTPAAVRFLSCEPLLGPVDLLGPADAHGARSRLTYWLHGKPGWGAPETTPSGVEVRDIETGPRIDWVIVGGESGPRARPMHPAWARSLRDQCQAAGVAYFLKQLGEWAPAPWRVEREPGEPVEDFKARAEAVCATHAHTGNSYQENGETVWHVHEAGHKPWSLERRMLLAPAEGIRRVGKKAAGRELDGRTWDEFPAVRA